MAEINNIRLGANQDEKVYIGDQLSWLYKTPDIIAPVTTIYPVTTNSYTAPRDIYFEVNEMCDTYYTTDGSTPTTSSTRYIAPVTINSDTTFKYFSVDVAGNVEAVKTSAYTITGASVTSISPSSTTQNTIPFTVTLTNNQGNAIYYKLGATGVQQTYSTPFAVSQDTAGVYDTQILVTYWSTGETEKTITYDTTGAIAGKPVVTATPGSGYVRLDWAKTANTTSYNVYRSTVSGQAGTLLSEYQASNSYDDNTPVNGTTYYYTVRSGNYDNGQLSNEVSAKPTAGVTSYRYVRYTGYGDSSSATTSRLVEIQAMHGATNRLLNKLPLAGYATVNGGAIAVATDGAFVQSSGYPLWWQGAGIPDLKYDMLDWYAIDTIKIAGFSSAVDPRQTKFKIQVSTDNLAWVTVADYSTNTTVQPTTGFSFPVT